jgi:hypothetical protein
MIKSLITLFFLYTSLECFIIYPLSFDTKSLYTKGKNINLAIYPSKLQRDNVLQFSSSYTKSEWDNSSLKCDMFKMDQDVALMSKKPF